MAGFPSNTFFSSLGFSGLGKDKHQKNTFSLTKKPNIPGRNFAWNKKNHQTYGIFSILKTSSPHLKDRQVYEKIKTGEASFALRKGLSKHMTPKGQSIQTGQTKCWSFQLFHTKTTSNHTKVDFWRTIASRSTHPGDCQVLSIECEPVHEKEWSQGCV